MGDEGDGGESSRKLPDLSVPQLEECMWVLVKEGKLEPLVKFLEERADHPKFKKIIDCENEEYEHEGGGTVLFCVHMGRDKGRSSKADYPGCMSALVAAGANVDKLDQYRRTPLSWCVHMKYINYLKHLLKLGARPDISDQDGRSPFHTAIILGYKDLLTSFIDHNPEIVHMRDSQGVPPLVIAAKHSQMDICRLLLDHGADVNAAEEKTKRTPVYHAIRNKHMEMFDLLLKHNPKLDTVDTEGQSPLYLCCAIPDVKYFHKLVAHCPKFSQSVMDQQAEDNKTPVIVACQNGNSEQLKHLLDDGATVNITDVEGKTGLHHCSDNLETQCAEMLLEKDPSILDIKDSQGHTALALAVQAGNTNLVKLLLDKGADLTTRDNEDHTLAHWASVCGHLKVMDVLMQHKADFSSPDVHHACPVHYAAQMNGAAIGHSDSRLAEKVLKKLIDYKVKLDVEDDTGRQPLHWAACSGNAASCKLLVMAGADVDSVDKVDLTALHCAASRGHPECIEVLLKKGANCNLMDQNKCTPLFYAITLGNKECTRALINAKADVNHVDDRGRNPSHCAAIKGCIDTLKLLEKEKAELWLQNNKGDYPIHEAAQKGHIDIVKHLIRVKNDLSAVNITNKVGKTLLHIAAATNNLPLCKMLLNHDCDKNATMKYTDKEFTAYDLAVIKNHTETADYLQSKGAVSFEDLNNTNKTDAKDGKKKRRGKQKDVELNPVADNGQKVSDNDKKGNKVPDSPSKKDAPSSKEKSPKKDGTPSKGSKSSEKNTAVAAGVAVVAGKGDDKNKKEEQTDSKTDSPKKDSKSKTTDSKTDSPKKDSVSKTADSKTDSPKKDSVSKTADSKTDSPKKDSKSKTDLKSEASEKVSKSEEQGGKDNTVSTEKAGQQTKENTKGKDSAKESEKGSAEKVSDEEKDKAGKKSPEKVQGLKRTNEDDKNSQHDSKVVESESRKKGDSSEPSSPTTDKKTVVSKSKQTETKEAKQKTTDQAKNKLQKQPSTDSVLDKEDGIRTSTVSLRSDGSPSSGQSQDQEQVSSRSGAAGQHRKMGTTGGKQKDPGGKFVSVERTETTRAKSESPDQAKTKKNHRVGFNKSDNEDSGNETDHSHSKRRHKKRSNFDHIYKSVKSYDKIRNNSRMMQQLKRAQIHTGPMHDIVMFSKMMDNYRKGLGSEAEEMDVRAYANWDGYLNEQLRFVSNLYNEDSKSPREVQDTAKEQHAMLETEANNRKKDTEMRCTLIMENEEVQRRKNTDMDREITSRASRTAEIFENVKTGATSTVASAKTRNSELRDEIRKTREEKLRSTANPHEREILRRQQMEDEMLEHEHELDSSRREKFKKWHSRKDEEMRRRLLQAYRPYFPNDVFQPRQVCVSGGRVKSAGRMHIDPSPVSSRRSHQSPRPGSHKSGTDSNYSVAQYKLKEDKTQVQMTPYGLRRVRNQERPTYANWSRKYDGSIRPRTGLVFVEPRVYDDLIKEEKQAKQRISHEVRASQTLINGDVRHGAMRNDRSDSLVS